MAFRLNIRDAKDPGTIEIYLYGDITRWNDDIAPSKVAQQIKDLEKKYTRCIVHINSNGGEVAEGIAIHKILSDTSMQLEIHVDGVAASMAAVLLQVPNATRVMSKYSKMMLHSPSGFINGSSEDLRQYAQMMDDFETTLIDIIADRCGFDSSEVKSKWFDNKDHWLNAQQALDEKLIDKIVDGMVTRMAPVDLMDPVAIFNFYDGEISKLENTMDYKSIISKLGLKAESTEAEILDFVGNLNAENANLKAQISGLQVKVEGLEQAAANARKQQITDMVDQAVTAKKITEAQRASYTALAEKDFDNTKVILDSLSPYKPLTEIADPTLPSDGISEDRKSWSFTDWQKKDGKGLQELKASNADAYKALYKKSFGKEPQL